jgi:carbon starvation protein
LSVATAILVKSGRLRYAWISAAPLAWLVVVTTTASLQKILSDDPKVGLFAAARDLSDKLAAGVLPADRAAVAPQLIFNQQLDAWLVAFFLVLVWIIVIDTLQRCIRHVRGGAIGATSEAPYVKTQLA